MPKKGFNQSEGHRKKIGVALSGQNNPNWGGGTYSKPLKEKIRRTFEYKLWRESVFKRDNWTCQDCGIKFIKGINLKITLQCDHIIPYKKIILENKVLTLEDAINCKELWDISNGRTLCKPCHLKTPTWGNRRIKERAIKFNLSDKKTMNSLSLVL